MTGQRLPERRRNRNRPAASILLLTGILGGCAYLAREAMIVYLKVNTEFSPKEIDIEIDKSFLEKYKNRVGITTTFTVDKSMQNPQSRLLDGDLHMAGRAPEVGLPVVAEIANAASFTKATDLVHAAERAGRPLKISGVWRIWAEHAKRAEEVQGEPLDPARSENPGHVFEVHPVTRINEIKLLESFRPIKGFLPGDASKTFGIYENVECTLKVKPGAISIITRTGIYNNVGFIMEIVDNRQIEVPGGRFVIASARDLKGDPLVGRLRMVFADDTPPEDAVRHLKRGDRLRVYGLPRINLEEISRRVRGSRADPALLTKPLPYEIIIQGVYEEAK